MPSGSFVPTKTSNNPPKRALSLIPGITVLLVALALSFAIFPEMTAVAVVLMTVIVLQYFLWGRWLGDLIRQEEKNAAVEDENP